MERHAVWLNSEYKAQDVTIFDDIDAAKFGFKVVNIFDKDNITQKISSRYKQGMGFTLCNHHKSIKIEIGLRRYESIIRIYREGQRGPEVQS